MRTFDSHDYGFESVQSSLNSSTIPLASAATYTGTWEKNNHPDVGVSLQTDNAGTLYFDFSPDGVNVNTFPTSGFTIASGVHEFHIARKLARFFRIRLVNASGAQSYLRLYTYYGSFGQPSIPLNQTIAADADSTLSRAVITAENPLGSFVSVPAALNGALKISNGATSIYGESIKVEYFPVIQTSHFYGISVNQQLGTTFSSGGGAIAANTAGNAAVLSIGTGVGDYIVYRSKRVLKYRHGYGAVARVSYKFAAGVANSLQFCGVGNSVSDLYFCYSGASFGVRRSHSGLLHVVKLTITAAAAGAESITIRLNTVAFTIALTNAGGATAFTAHQVEIGGTGAVAWTGWDVEHIGSTIYFLGDSVGARSGTYSFVNNTGGGTAAGTFTTEKVGAALSSDFVAQADWNGNSPMVANLDPLENNLYSIWYSWFGSSNIEFRVYNPDSGDFETVHTERYSNGEDANYSLSNANLYIQNGIASLGSTTAMTNTTTGCFGGILGLPNIQKQPKASASNSVSIAANTETVILLIQNRLQINGFPNQSELLLKSISAAGDGNRPVVIKIIKNPTTISANTTSDYTSLTLFSTAGLLLYGTNTRTYTGGQILKQFLVPKDDGVILDFDDEFFLARDDTFVITATSTAVNVVDVAATFLSDI